jgi:thiamine monophosphate synthase
VARVRLHSMQLCAITDRREATRPLLALVEDWSAGGVHFIQLREKDLSAPALQALAREVLAKIDRSRSKLLVNVSTPKAAALALAAGADGVILPVNLNQAGPAGCGRHFAPPIRSSASPVTAWKRSMWPLKSQWT